MAGLQLASLACLWALQHVALRARRWRPVITSQLAGNALSKIAPGGGALGAALQYRILVQAGLPAGSTVAALTAVEPARLRGRARAAGARDPRAAARLRRPHAARDGDRRHRRSSRSLCGIGAVLLSTDRPLRWIGRTVQRVRNRAAPQGRAAARPAGAAAARARPHPRDARAQAGSARSRRRSGSWTFDYLHAAGRARGDRLAPAAGARPAGVLRRPGARADPGHARRARASSRPA